MRESATRSEERPMLKERCRGVNQISVLNRPADESYTPVRKTQKEVSWLQERETDVLRKIQRQKRCGGVQDKQTCRKAEKFFFSV